MFPFDQWTILYDILYLTFKDKDDNKDDNKNNVDEFRFKAFYVINSMFLAKEKDDQNANNEENKSDSDETNETDKGYEIIKLNKE